MKPTAIVIEDSITESGERCLSILTRHARMIHAEVLTHRTFGRNGRSSRAVPVKRLLQEPILEPLFYGANQAGMSAGGELTGWRYYLARLTWLGLAHLTKAGVRVLHFAGLHKQWANRPLEWFGAIDCLITSTDWANFLALRDHEAAQPEIRALAQAVKVAIDASTPKLLKPGMWHMPFVSMDERASFSIQEQLVLSTARCARLTFAPFDGKADYAAEQARYRRLVVDTPVHASPAEHQATPDEPGRFSDRPYKNPHLHGNLRGWIQHRKLLANEAVFDAPYKLKAA